jgi:hypothetical protein
MEHTHHAADVREAEREMKGKFVTLRGWGRVGGSMHVAMVPHNKGPLLTRHPFLGIGLDKR